MAQTELRCGFTTGTCAAAAAKAAVLAVLCKEEMKTILLTLPDGRREEFSLELVHIEMKELCQRQGTEEFDGNCKVRTAVCAVRKSAGDDPDVTDKVLVFARVCLYPDGFLEKVTDKPCFHSSKYPFLHLTGGEGIGIVTKEGLYCEPGFYAINPQPQSQIFDAAAQAYQEVSADCKSHILIEISIPAGRELAKQTFNPRLGIEGGISVLGTTGIVHPMSEKALVETIRLDIRVKAREGRRILAVSPGNYGERFLKEAVGISMDSFVKCSNYVGDAFAMMAEEGIEGVLFAGHIGKLIKVAGGVLNTHSSNGDRRMEILEGCAEEAGVLKELRKPLPGMNTTEEAVTYLRECACLEPVMEAAVSKIKTVLEEHSGISVEIVMFSNLYGVLGQTKGVKSILQILHKGGA